jgi:hypothetical protein
MIFQRLPVSRCRWDQMRRSCAEVLLPKSANCEKATGQRRGSKRAGGNFGTPGTDAADFVGHRWQRRIRIGGIPLLPEVIRRDVMDRTVGYFLLVRVRRSWRITN